MSSNRLLSLDVLRGFDLFMLVFLQPVLIGFLSHFTEYPVAAFLLHELDHEVWIGFRAWDLVMPLFLFMTGVAIPFSISHYGTPGHRTVFLRRVVRRFVILFILGAVVQGNLFALDSHQLRLYSNTLQAIATGYLVTSVALLTLDWRKQVALAVALLLVYWLPMTFFGDFTPEGNFAEAVERAVMGRFRDGVWWDESGWHFSPDYNYTWIWSSLTFSFTVLSGALAGQIVKRNVDKVRNARLLLLVGLGCTVLGALWAFQMPIIKRIWTSSMALYSSGLCFLLLAVFYYIIDCSGRTRGVRWLCFYGMNSIAAYMLGEWLNFRPLVEQVTYGLQPLTGDYYPIILTLGHVTLIFLLLRFMFKRGIYLKV